MGGDRPEPLHSRLPRLRAEKGLSQSRLSRATTAFDGEGLAEVTIKRLEASPGHPRALRASPETIEKLAFGLGVEPEEFPEYRLALARRELDERVVGLDQAIDTLEKIRPALADRRRDRKRRAAARASDSQKRPRANPRAQQMQSED